MATMHRLQPRPARPRDARLPRPRQLAALGTVLCLYRPQPGGELAGWTQAMAATAGSDLDGKGLCEQLRFFDRDGRCCWQLCLLPDSDFLAWEGVVASLPRNDLRGTALPPVHDRPWQRLACRWRGEHWQASVLRLHAVHHDGEPALAASLASVSLLGAAVAGRITRAHGAQGEAFVGDRCTRTRPSNAKGSEMTRQHLSAGKAAAPGPRILVARLAWLALLASPVALAQDLAAASGSPDPARDHASILAMQGDYIVDFAFDETVLLKPGYERAPAMRSGGNEKVFVVQDTPGRIVLQHILVDEKSGHVTKHWRQDWTWQAATRFEFSADQTWTVRALDAAATQGTWTQCVFEVSDAPRYCGTGKWAYLGQTATWTSDMTWRPLPRREYTRRSDYNAVAGINRHTITPSGWTHEQFNTKVLRNADGTRTEIARESGFNDYQKATEVDFKPAVDYWAATAAYWARVRGHWDAGLSKPPGVHLKTKIDGMAMIIPLFGQAESIESGKAVSDAEIDAVFAKWVEPATP